MDLNEFQKFCERTAVYPKELGPAYCLTGLLSEAGEVAGKMKKYLRGDYGYEAMQDGVISELGDVLWYIAMLSKELDTSLDDLAKKVLNKLEARYEAGTIRGDGDNR